MAVFLDSNIVLYALGDDLAKRSTALHLLEMLPYISTQVVNECSHVLRRKQNLPSDRIAALMENLLKTTAYAETTLSDIRSAWTISQRHGYGHYDSLIVATAVRMRCSILYTEDLHHDQLIYGQLRLCNPFLTAI